VPLRLCGELLQIRISKRKPLSLSETEGRHGGTAPTTETNLLYTITSKFAITISCRGKPLADCVKTHFNLTIKEQAIGYRVNF